MYTGENQAITAKESRLLEQSSTMISVFKEASRNFIIFSLSEGSLKLTNQFAHVKKVMI
jgi:hypothetical protein